MHACSPRRSISWHHMECWGVYYRTHLSIQLSATSECSYIYFCLQACFQLAAVLDDIRSTWWLRIIHSKTALHAWCPVSKSLFMLSMWKKTRPDDFYNCNNNLTGQTTCTSCIFAGEINKSWLTDMTDWLTAHVEHFSRSFIQSKISCPCISKFRA